MTRTWTKIHRSLISNHRYAALKNSDSRLLYRHALDLSDDSGRIDQERLYLSGFRPFRKDKDHSARNRFRVLIDDLFRVGLLLVTEDDGVLRLYKFGEKTGGRWDVSGTSVGPPTAQRHPTGSIAATTYVHRGEENRVEEKPKPDLLRKSERPDFRKLLWDRIKDTPGMRVHQAKPVMSGAFRARKSTDFREGWINDAGILEAAAIVAGSIARGLPVKNTHALITQIARKETLRTNAESSETDHRNNVGGSELLTAILNGRAPQCAPESKETVDCGRS
jgi:hypothetical protein